MKVTNQKHRYVKVGQVPTKNVQDGYFKKGLHILKIYQFAVFDGKPNSYLGNST